MIGPFPDAPATRFSLSCVDNTAELTEVEPAWQRLVETAIEPNVFFEPLCLIPALTHLANAGDVRCILVWASPRSPSAASKAGYSGPVLCGLFPIYQDRGLRMKQGIWVHDYAYSGVPLVRSDCASLVIESFLQWLDTQQVSSFRWPFLPVNTRLYRALLQQLQRRDAPVYVQKNFLRAEYQPANDTESYLRRAMSSSTRKELLRMERRLHEVGEVKTAALDSDAEVQPWINSFLELESSGWKGDRATALKSSGSSREFFEEMLRNAHQARRLVMLKLLVDGVPIAMNVGLRDADAQGGVYFKIAHDEKFRRFMPGRILELEFIRWLHQQPDIHWFDSCAAPNHQMIERLWDGRRHVQSFWTGNKSRAGRFKVALLAMLSEAKILFRNSLNKDRNND